MVSDDFKKKAISVTVCTIIPAGFIGFMCYKIMTELKDSIPDCDTTVLLIRASVIIMLVNSVSMIVNGWLKAHELNSILSVVMFL